MPYATPTIESIDANIEWAQQDLDRIERQAGQDLLMGRPRSVEETREIRTELAERLMQLRQARAILVEEAERRERRAG